MWILLSHCQPIEQTYAFETFRKSFCKFSKYSNKILIHRMYRTQEHQNLFEYASPHTKNVVI